jgi:hypothetical protein
MASSVQPLWPWAKLTRSSAMSNSITSKTQKVIGLWLDRTESAGHSHDGQWIVSRDSMDDHGFAELTNTLSTHKADEYDAAREVAVKLGRKEGRLVIETDECGAQKTIYAPKIITISDVGTTVMHRLSGDRFDMIESGGCGDGLKSCLADDEMSDEDIIDAVRDSWISACTENMGEEYDADLNVLSVRVENEQFHG